MHTVINKVEACINDMMKQWTLPGISIAMVKNGEVVNLNAFGKRSLKDDLPMETNTHLPIGSVTKSFTATAVSMLVEEGKLDWDTPVIQYVPWLKLQKEEVQNNATLRDLLSHNTGMAKYDAHAVFCTKDDRKEMIEDLQYLEFGTEFRSGVQYSNQMVMLAGYIVEVVSGMSWEEFVQERILNPLGMTNTTFKAEEIDQFDNYSFGYVFTGQDYMQTQFLPLRGVSPAGSICSTAEDMAKYVAFQMSDGMGLVSKESLDMMHTKQANGTPYFWSFEEITDTNYGLGWFTDTYKGTKMVSHGGNTLGFSSLVTLLPEYDFGLALLTNGNSNFLIYPLTYMILDQIMNKEETDWNAKFQETIGAIFAAMAQGQEAMMKAQVQGTTPSLSLVQLQGTYSHPAFGTLTLQENNNQLMGKLNNFDALLTHFNYDDFLLMLPLMGLTLPAKFIVEDNTLKALAIVFEPTPGINPVLFTK